MTVSAISPTSEQSKSSTSARDMCAGNISRERGKKREREHTNASHKNINPPIQKMPKHQNSKTHTTKLIQRKTHNKDNSVNSFQIQLSLWDSLAKTLK